MESAIGCFGLLWRFLELVPVASWIVQRCWSGPAETKSCTVWQCLLILDHEADKYMYTGDRSAIYLRHRNENFMKLFAGAREGAFHCNGDQAAGRGDCLGGVSGIER